MNLSAKKIEYPNNVFSRMEAACSIWGFFFSKARFLFEGRFYSKSASIYSILSKNFAL